MIVDVGRFFENLCGTEMFAEKSKAWDSSRSIQRAKHDRMRRISAHETLRLSSSCSMKLIIVFKQTVLVLKRKIKNTNTPYKQKE